ncbi:uncharacterized protein [Eucyclogobius newberryi]|uniref:uncharacterized protein n=1 Tax=Eucyclogobius newberryi TaxID=166745 RepID=UPI003B5C6455
MGSFLRWLVALSGFTLAQEKNKSEESLEGPVCQAGFYCPPEAPIPIPCPVGNYGPNPGVAFTNTCLACPSHHYCPRAALALPLPCAPAAQQPLSGQDTCVCPGEGQNFQASDAQCHCSLGYQPSNNKMCVLKLYDVCRNGKTRTQYGECLDRYQWSVHCKYQVCPSAEDFGGFDSELGLCLCKEPRMSCGSLCRRRTTDELKLRCQSNGELELIWRHEDQVSSISGRVLQTLFLHWDPLETLQCSQQLNISHPVHIVQTAEEGFFGILGGLPEELDHIFPMTSQQETERFPESVLWEASQIGNISHGDGEIHFASSRGNWSQFKGIDRKPRGILNPTTCLHLEDIILFTVSTNHFPEYDVDNLYNTNPVFDWGAFRQLKEELTLSWTPPSFFSFVFHQPGVYVFKLSSHEHKHMYVRVMPADGQCYEPGPFFSTTSRHLNRVGINRRRELLLRPDWFVAGGLVCGAVILLGLCVTLLILFLEYGWPEKKPIKVRYRLLHLAYNMDDYASKGSRVMSLRKIHRNQQARMTLDSTPPDPENFEEFWDYEHQVDMEAFSSTTFYSLLLEQSLSVTSRLGQLTSEVKELYQGVTMKLQLLQPCLITEDRMGDNYEKIKREVEREVGRRKSIGSQLRTILHNQLQVLKREQQAQMRVHTAFTAQLRECTRLLSKLYGNHQPICEQNLINSLTSTIERMADLFSMECQRQGAWGFLGEGVGAKLLCPETGSVLTKNHIFGPEGSLLISQALRYDSVTGLMRPNAHSHMLLSSGHTMAVPPNYFVHPQTGRVMPIAGNVAYDPASSTLVFTVDSSTGDNVKWDSPLLPFIPYPTYHHSGQPLSRIRLRGLRPGQGLQLGVPMADPETGVPVPILGVTIHPDTGLVYPLGGLHTCPVTRQRQPIQIGCPMLDSRTGNLVLTVGVSLDSVTGAVLPVGGILLYDFFVEPLSGRRLRVGGASIRAGQVVPHGGGYQTFLDCKVLAEMSKVLELHKQLTDEWTSDQAPLHMQMSRASERGSGRLENVPSVVKELQQAWGRRLHCHLQLQTRLEMLLAWSEALECDGGACGKHYP